MEFANGERNYAFAGTANKTSRSVHTKTTKPVTSSGCSPSSGYLLVQRKTTVESGSRACRPPCLSCKKSLSQPETLLDRGRKSAFLIFSSIRTLNFRFHRTFRVGRSFSFLFGGLRPRPRKIFGFVAVRVRVNEVLAADTAASRVRYVFRRVAGQGGGKPPHSQSQALPREYRLRQLLTPHS